MSSMETPTLYGAQIGAPAPVPAKPVRYCLYARKSSESEEKQALSIDSQIKEMVALAQRDNLNIVEIYRESHSAKACGQRPIFNQLLNDIRLEKFDGIVVWHPDRLSRNAGDLGAIVDLLDQKRLIEIRTHSQRFTNNPNEKFLLMILGSQAKLENDNKSINVKRGLRTKCEMGLWPSVAPTGYLNSKNANEKGKIYIDPDRSVVIKEIFVKVSDSGWSGRKIYRWLKEIRFITKSGKPLTLSNIYTILNNHFYYGRFEYPKNSGHWYQGNYSPLVSKDLFDAAQKQLQSQRKIKPNVSKEFSFTRLMSCGFCGSGISAEEKYKNLADGSVATYIYYGCTRARDKDCQNRYLEEKMLLSQLLELSDKIDLDRSGIKNKLASEIARHEEFHLRILGKEHVKYHTNDIDIRNYFKYILKNGSIFDKRDLMDCLRSKVILKNKEIFVEERT
jgi:site-specific DNA recombinase